MSARWGPVAVNVNTGLLSYDSCAVDRYGADPTGVADSTAAFNLALASMPTRTVTNANGTAVFPVGTLVLGAGTYRLGSTSDVNNLGPYVTVSCPGTNTTVIDYRGANQAFRVYNNIRPVSDTFIDLAGLGSSVSGLTIDGTNCQAGAVGLKVGDVEGLVLGPSLTIQNFSKAGCSGLLFWNEFAWTENVKAWANVFNCTVGVKFYACAGSTLQNAFIGGDNSFMYNDMTFKIYSFGGQDGVVLDNGATFQGGALKIRANMANAASLPTNALLRVTGVAPVGHLGAGTNSQLYNCYLELQGETNGPGAFGPYTLYLGDPGANYVVNCLGVLAFNGGKWRLSNWTLAANFANGSFTYQGYVSGDTNLAPADGGGGVVSGAQYLSRSTLFTDGGASFHQGDFLGPTTLTQNMTVSLQGAKGGPQRKTIFIRQAASGGPYTVTWPKPGSPTLSSPAVYWPAGSAPTMTATAGALDRYDLSTVDGVRWYGTASQNLS